MFQGGGTAWAIGTVLGLDIKNDEEIVIARLLHQTGLADIVPLSVPFLRFDPALAPALLRDLLSGPDGPAAEAAARVRWAEAYRQLANFLVGQQSEDAHLAAHLTILELPNLLAALRLFDRSLLSSGDEPDQPPGASPRFAPQPAASAVRLIEADPETVIQFATTLERLLQFLGRREALAEASAIRERAHRIHQQTGGGTWTRAAFLTAQQHTERLLGSGRFGEAVASANSLVEKTAAAGDHAYSGADYDQALAQIMLGRALKMASEPQAALEPLAEAQRRFESLAETMANEDHRKTAARMASACLTDEADCLSALGQLDAAAAK